jgi:hypothetical protein
MAGLVQVGNEEVAAAGLVKRARHLPSAEAIGVGFDDTGNVTPRMAGTQRLPVGHHRGQIDV